jgi:hypothetical protein
VLTKNKGHLKSPAVSDAEKSKFRRLANLLTVNLLCPLIITVIYIRIIFETLLVPDYLTEVQWKVFRIAFIVFTLCMRMMTFREELQFFFNESYFLVQRLMQDKNETLFRYIKLRIQENFLNTWYAIF